jgi:uncharacterized RDD family membrane protein YckC
MSLNQRAMLDTINPVETPEGIELHLPVAGLVSRAMAWVIDTLIRGLMYIILAAILAPMGKTGIGILLVLTFFIEWFYWVIFEVKRGGKTPGKSSMGLMVIHDDGTPISWGASMIRNLLRVADFLPLFYGFGIVSMIVSKDFKRLGDHAAGTLVVYEEKPKKPAEKSDAQPLRPAFPLQLEEQQALLAFDERSLNLTGERAQELAELTGPLLEDQKHPVDALRGMAHWLAGERGKAS